MNGAQTDRVAREHAALELVVAAANLSLYVRLTPMELIRWPQVAAALDRLDRLDRMRELASGESRVAGNDRV